MTSRGRIPVTLLMMLAVAWGLSIPVRATEGPSRSASAVPKVSWPMFHLSLDRTGFNRHETILSPSTVGGLTLKWSSPLSDGCSGSPAVANGMVYIGDFSGTLSALDSETGAPRWTEVVGSTGTSDPALGNGLLYITGELNGMISALDPTTGVLRWSRWLEGSSFSSPAVAGRRIFVGSIDGLWALDGTTGAVLWHSTKVGFASGPPTVVQGVVYAATDDPLAKLYALDARTGALLRSTDIGPQHTGPDTAVAVGGGLALAGTHNGGLGSLFAVDASTGSVSWVFPHEVHGTPAVANRSVFVGSTDGGLYSVDVVGGGVHWSVDEGFGEFVSPAVANGVVYAGTDMARAYRASDGALLWAFSPSDQQMGTPAVVDGTLYVCSFDGDMYAFSLPG